LFQLSLKALGALEVVTAMLLAQEFLKIGSWNSYLGSTEPYRMNNRLNEGSPWASWVNAAKSRLTHCYMIA